MGVFSREEERWQCNGRPALPRRLHASPAPHFHGKACVPAGGNNKKKKNTTACWSTDTGSLLQCTMTSRSRMRPHIQMCPTIAGAPKRPTNVYTRDTRTAERGGEPRKYIRTYAPLRPSTHIQTSQYNTCFTLCS